MGLKWSPMATNLQQLQMHTLAGPAVQPLRLCFADLLPQGEQAQELSLFSLASPTVPWGHTVCPSSEALKEHALWGLQSLPGQRQEGQRQENVVIVKWLNPGPGLCRVENSGPASARDITVLRTGWGERVPHTLPLPAQAWICSAEPTAGGTSLSQKGPLLDLPRICSCRDFLL